MGANNSSLLNKAKPSNDCFLPFTRWNLSNISYMKKCHETSLSSSFALALSQFSQLINQENIESNATINMNEVELFQIYDENKNSLIDSFEVMSSITMLSSISLRKKFHFIFSLYDFNESGQLNFDEIIMLFRTVVYGCSKIDDHIYPPTIKEIEILAKEAFHQIKRDISLEITQNEFDAFCFSNPRIKNFLEYFKGNVNQVVISGGKFFTDEDFLNDPTSLYLIPYEPPVGLPNGKIVEWHRPTSICPSLPYLFANSTLSYLNNNDNKNIIYSCATNLIQGQLKNLWFLSALSLISSKPSLLTSLFIKTGQEEQGRYCIRYFKESNWKNIIIDDKIPCDVLNRPLFSHSSDRNEIWPMLIEKGYAKLHGCYETLTKGKIENALRDLSGGSVELIKIIKKKNQNLLLLIDNYWEKINNNLNENKLIGCIHKKTKKNSLDDLKGLLSGHLYSILYCYETNVSNRKWICLNDCWENGQFKQENENMTDDELNEINNNINFNNNNNHMWLLFETFISIFNRLYILNLFENENNWIHQKRDGLLPETGGGSINNKSWINNPQFFLNIKNETNINITLSQPDLFLSPKYSSLNDDINENDNKSLTKSNLIRLSPNQNAINRNNINKVNYISWGFILIEFDWGEKDAARLCKHISKSNVKFCNKTFIKSRDLYQSLTLSPGRYIIIPMSFHPNIEKFYWITLISDKNIEFYSDDEVILSSALDASNNNNNNNNNNNENENKINDTHDLEFQVIEKKTNKNNEMKDDNNNNNNNNNKVDNDDSDDEDEEIDDLDDEEEFDDVGDDEEQLAMKRGIEMISQMWDIARSLQEQKAKVELRIRKLELQMN